MKITKTAGKAACIALYAFFVYLAAKKNFIPLIALVALHTTEYFVIGRKTGREFSIHPVKTVLLCLSFGFTWWLPVRTAGKTEQK